MKAAIFIAAGFGAGYAPKAPGTFGSLLGLVLGLLLLRAGHAALFAAAIVTAAGGLWAIRRAPHEDDPGWIVIDEIAGQFCALLALSRVTLAGAVIAFALFRLFDIAKPGPVGWADAQHNAFGIMADDIVAGALAAICIFLLRLIPGVYL